MSEGVSSDPNVVAAARWFWWIAGLSLVNTVLLYSGANLSFVVGLGITTLANVYFADQLAVAAAITIATLGFYFLVGLHAQRGRAWAFYVGMVVYAIDAAIYVYFEDWMSVAFHGFVIYVLIKGVRRLHELARAPA